uniref:Uncharacterized protein n=1 Tax=Myotis myotis TaxID=51298 RepID=A0A7J7Z5P9_MYOMY|nr:hypothetical protein mMyoMyo1_010702 [Myotis myotis]
MTEMEESKRLDIEFKTTFIRFFKNFMETADKFSETLEDMKKDQLEIKHTLTEIKNNIQPNQFGSVDGASACGLKGPRFDTGQGHVPWLRAHPQWGVCRRQLIDVSRSLMFLTLYPSPFLSVKNQ